MKKYLYFNILNTQRNGTIMYIIQNPYFKYILLN